MPRPICCRRVHGLPGSTYFKPRGVPLVSLEVLTMTVDEFEALRLADGEGLYQEEAAARMNISRQTFGRIVEAARKKVAEALVHGKALKIEGGEIDMIAQRTFECGACQHTWSVLFGTSRPAACPECKSTNICRAVQDRGGARGQGWGGGQGQAGRMGRGRCRRGTQKLVSGGQGQ